MLLLLLLLQQHHAARWHGSSSASWQGSANVGSRPQLHSTAHAHTALSSRHAMCATACAACCMLQQAAYSEILKRDIYRSITSGLLVVRRSLTGSSHRHPDPPPGSPPAKNRNGQLQLQTRRTVNNTPPAQRYGQSVPHSRASHVLPLRQSAACIAALQHKTMERNASLTLILPAAAAMALTCPVWGAGSEQSGRNR